LCCGERDCFELTDADVKSLVGYFVVSMKETIPFQEATLRLTAATGVANGRCTQVFLRASRQHLIGAERATTTRIDDAY